MDVQMERERKSGRDLRKVSVGAPLSSEASTLVARERGLRYREVQTVANEVRDARISLIEAQAVAPDLVVDRPPSVRARHGESPPLLREMAGIRVSRHGRDT
ncbi:MAG: hypothetical protein M3P18_21465 [Actinomycetota bacterium]|nr:hypothetical protein [Actinomycetota bacterium]